MKLNAVLISTLVVVATPTKANEVQIGHNIFAVSLNDFDAHPATLAAAMRGVIEIEKAAMVACGASGSDLLEIRRALRRSDCWRESMADARNQIDDPLLIQAWQRRWPTKSRAARR